MASPNTIQAPPTTRAPSWKATTVTSASAARSAPSALGMGIEPDPTAMLGPALNARGRSGSRKRMTITDRWAIVNASIAPKAKMPARNSRSVARLSANAMTAARQIVT